MRERSNSAEPLEEKNIYFGIELLELETYMACMQAILTRRACGYHLPSYLSNPFEGEEHAPAFGLRTIFPGWGSLLFTL